MQDSDDYRSLLQQYELLMQQLEMSQKETRTLKEQVERSRRESLAMTSQRDSASVAIRFELESQKKEVARLTQIIESLRTELESTKQENSQVVHYIVHFKYHSRDLRLLYSLQSTLGSHCIRNFIFV